MSEAQALRHAREELRQGNKAAAREILTPLLRANLRSEIGWMLMSVAVDDPLEERDCLQMVLWINPDNEIAQRHLARLDRAQTPFPASILRPIAQPAEPPPVAPPALKPDTSVPPSVTTQKPTEVTSPGNQGKKKRTVWIVVVAVIASVLVCCGLIYLLAWMAPSTDDGPSSTGTNLAVEYRISGSGESASVTYENASGGTEQRDPMPLPYTVVKDLPSSPPTPNGVLIEKPERSYNFRASMEASK